MILILGAGGCAREAFFHMRDVYKNKKMTVPEIVFYDDISGIQSLQLEAKSYSVVSSFDGVSKAKFIVATGDPATKQKLVSKALAAGLQPADTIIHPQAIIQDKTSVKVGKGGIISPNCVLTTNITMGDYVVVGVSVAIGHDTVIKNFTTLNPGAVISGNVLIKENVLIGAGAVVIEKTTIEKNITLGAQSCVTKNLMEESHIYLGIPAKIKSRDTEGIS